MSRVKDAAGAEPREMLGDDDDVRAIRNKDQEQLPKMPDQLPGSVLPQMVRCGRPGCRCARGQLHGPYYYLFWRERGRLRKAYVRPEDLDAVRDACRRRQRAIAEVRLALSESHRQWRELMAAVRRLRL